MVEDMQAEHRQVMRLFGDGARVGGSMGCALGPGVLTISVDGKPWGSGRTIEAAICDASRQASRLSVCAAAG